MCSTKKISPETAAICELLGRLDCTFWPSFPLDQRNRTVCWEWQKSWLSGVGLPVRSTNSNEIERKDTERLWKNLERSGLVSVSRKKGRRSHVRFTTTGETLARGICATGSCFDYWLEFESFASLCEEIGETTIPASCSAGVEPWEPGPEAETSLYMQTCHFLPFATAGYVDFSLDTRGCLWIGLTLAGRQVIDDPPEEPPGADDWDLVEEASDVYEAAFSAARQELSIARPDHPSNLIIPRVPTGWGDFKGYLDRQRERNREREERRRRCEEEVLPS